MSTTGKIPNMRPSYITPPTPPPPLGKPYPLSRASSHVIFDDSKPATEKKNDNNFGLLGQFPYDVRAIIYKHLVTYTPIVSVLSTTECTMPCLYNACRSFRNEIRYWQRLTRNRSLKDTSFFHRICGPILDEDIPATHVVDFTTYNPIPCQDLIIRLNRFQRLYDVRNIDSVVIKPIMALERKSGLERRNEDFMEVMKVLKFLKCVKSVDLRLSSKGRCKEERKKYLDRFLERKMGVACALKDERNCEWPMEIVWSCFAVALEETVGVMVRVFMDGEELDLEKMVCGYMKKSVVMVRLTRRVLKRGKDMEIKRRDLHENCHSM